VEIAGWDEVQKDAITRQHLNFIWMDQSSVEVKVLIDLSNSMQVHNKLDQAKLAAKYVSGGFLSSDPNYNVSNVEIEIIGFNSTVQTIPINPPAHGDALLDEVYKSIETLNHSGNTAMYDAVSYGLSRFSSNPQSLKIMYVISDGLDNQSTKSLNDVVSEYRKAQVAIHTFAYGKDAEKDALGDMARLTGGTFFDQEESLFLKVGNSVTTVLANAYNAQQSYAGSLGPQNATEQVLNLPSTAKRLLLMMEHQGVLNDHSVNVRTATGADLPLHADLDVIDGRTFARLEADLSALSASDFPLSLVSVSQNWNVRVVSQYDRLPEYSMDVEVTPMGQVLYPKPITLYSRVLKEGALVEDAEYLVRIMRPDGSVVQKQFSPGLAPMRYTFMDYNAGGTYAWEIQSVSSEYSLVQNGQFVLEAYAVDDHPAPPEDVSPMLPQENYGGIINFAGDADWFVLQGLEQNQSYTVHFSAVEGDQDPQFAVYSPSDLTAPLYSSAGNVAGESRILSLGTDWSVNGGYIKIDGLAEGSKWEVVLHKSKSSNIPVGRFEVASDWSSPHTTLSQSNILPAEGGYSLESTPGWRTISSRHVSTDELQVLASQIAIDVSIPNELVNPWWVGNLELKVRVLSSNASYSLGGMQELKAVQGGWQTYYFPVSDDLLNKIQEPHPDLVFDIQVNGPDNLRLDNMRFVGDLKFNTVAQWEQICPGVGCDTANPLDLGPVNHATTVVPYGDLYLQISQYPTDYVPQRIVVGISPEDGAELTGQLGFAGQSTSLSGWYQQIEFPFDGAEAMLLQLYNVGDRPYRITWWADGQAPVVVWQK